MQLTAGVALIVMLGGCLGGTHRYVDVAGPVEATRVQLETDARSQGLLVEHERRASLFFVDEPETERLRARQRLVLAARFFALAPDRTRIEFRNDLDVSVKLRPSPDGVRITPVEEFGWSEWLGIGIEPSVSAGVGYDPEHGMAGRLDWALRVGKRVWRFGDVDDAIRVRTALVANAGVGIRFGPEAEAFRPELSLSVVRQRAAWYVPWWQLTTGPRTVYDLSIAGLIERGGRRGFEVGVAIRRPPWVGVYVRAGGMRGSDTASGGPTFSIGIEGGSVPSIGGLAIGVVLATVVAALGASATEGIQDVLGGG